jgi:hypothetical protein
LITRVGLSEELNRRFVGAALLLLSVPRGLGLRPTDSGRRAFDGHNRARGSSPETSGPDGTDA